MDTDDRTDVERVLAGDVDAFATIVHRWNAPLLRLARRFAGDEAVAEEMVQEAFVRAYRGLAGWRGDSAFSTWLFAVALNVCRTTARRLGPRVEPLDEVTSPGGPWESLAAAERAAVVRRAVAALPARYRDAVVLFYFHEQSLQETTEILGVREGTLKARLHRARKLLQARLERMLAP